MPEQDRPMLACGHTANSLITTTGQPACAICDCVVQVPNPNLAGRTAACGCCSTQKPSNSNLPFFCFWGEGSPHATNYCVCGCYITTHVKKDFVCTNGRFQARGPAEYDYFYCGCQGWD